MQPSWHMAKLPQERLTRWRAMTMWAMKKGFLSQISRKGEILVLLHDALKCYLTKLSILEARTQMLNTQYPAPFCKFTKKKFMIYWTLLYSKLKTLRFRIWNWNGSTMRPIKLKICSLLKWKASMNACSCLKKV